LKQDGDFGEAEAQVVEDDTPVEILGFTVRMAFNGLVGGSIPSRWEPCLRARE